MKYKIGEVRIKDLLDNSKYLTNINIQRKFIYSNKDATYLLDSISRNIPLPAIYLWENKNGTYDVIDGKQRITVFRIYNNPKHLKDKIINFFVDSLDVNLFENYKIPTLICEGKEEEKVETYKRINTTAKPLTEFEILNALYQGTFIDELGDFGISLTDDESRIFGKDIRGNNCIKILELFTNKSSSIEEYVKFNKNNSFVIGLKKDIEILVENVINIFGDYNEDMYVLAKIVKENNNMLKLWKKNRKTITELFVEHSNNGDLKISPSKESFYKEMLACYEVTGLDSQRFFDTDFKKKLYNKLSSGKVSGKKICSSCKKEFSFSEFEIDHIIPWSKGGKTTLDNAQLLCKSCNTKKSSNF
jgi:hypothetical protein